MSLPEALNLKLLQAGGCIIVYSQMSGHKAEASNA